MFCCSSGQHTILYFANAGLEVVQRQIGHLILETVEIHPGDGSEGLFFNKGGCVDGWLAGVIGRVVLQLGVRGSAAAWRMWLRVVQTVQTNDPDKPRIIVIITCAGKLVENVQSGRDT